MRSEKQICADLWFEKYTPDFEWLIYIFGFDNLILQFSEADRPMFRETKFLIWVFDFEFGDANLSFKEARPQFLIFRFLKK